MKRLVCFLLTVIMLVGMIPVATNAVGDTVAFKDVKESHWWYEAVTYCVGNGLLNGMSDNKFEPKTTLTRAMFVKALANFEGIDEAEYIDDVTPFTDVKAGQWYYAAVEWARQNEITGGVSETKFAPNKALTREQMARLFHQYAIYKGMDVDNTTDVSSFADAGKINSWAVDGMKYCVGAGLFVGDNNKLTPRATANRAQLAVVLMKFHQLEPATPDYEGRIIFWGDSLTQGITGGFKDLAEVPYPERVGEILGVEIKNYGIGSEATYQIASRQGALPVYAYASEDEPFVIPAEGATEICLYNYDVEDEYGNYNHIGVGEHNLFAGINPVTIAGVVGEISWVAGKNYQFTRLEPGEEMTFTEFVQVETFGMTDKREDDIVVIWVGHNDCPEANEVDKHDKIVKYIADMIDYAGTEKFLVLGMMAERYAPGYNEVNAKIQEYLESIGAADKFLDVRTYLADPQHLEDLGITPTERDLEWIEKGWIPSSLHAETPPNELHLNQMGYDLLAEYVAEKLVDLGYFE